MSQAPAIQRKLTTILAADAANFSGRMQTDEIGTVQALRRSRAVFEKGIASRGGRIANTAGDGLIAEFPSVVEAVAAAVVIQRELVKSPDLLPFRIGLHLGDVIVDGNDLLGDGVNLAARLQEMAREGGILATQQVVDHAHGRLDAEFRALGMTQPKHFNNELTVFAVVADGVPAPATVSDVGPWFALQRPDAGASILGKRARKYAKDRKRNTVAMAGFAGLDLITGSGFGWCMYPILGILLIQGWSWAKLDDHEKSALGTMLRQRASSSPTKQDENSA